MKLLRVLAIGGAVCALAAGAPAADEKIDPKLLLGLWEVTKNNAGTVQEGSTFEFAKDGVAVLNLKIKDKSRKFDLVYTLDGDKLTTKVKDTTGDRKMTIKKLTDKELVWEEAGGKTIELTRKK